MPTTTCSQPGTVTGSTKILLMKISGKRNRKLVVMTDSEVRTVIMIGNTVTSKSWKGTCAATKNIASDLHHGGGRRIASTYSGTPYARRMFSPSGSGLTRIRLARRDVGAMTEKVFSVHGTEKRWRRPGGAPLSGGAEVVRPLVRSKELQPELVYVLYLCWHVATIVMIAFVIDGAGAAFHASFRPFALAATIVAGAIALSEDH